MNCGCSISRSRLLAVTRGQTWFSITQECAGGTFTFKWLMVRHFGLILRVGRGCAITENAQKSGWLGGDGIVHAGPYVIRRFVDDNLTDNRRAETKLPRVAPLVAQAYGDTTLPEVALEFLNGPSQATSWPVRRVMSLIGSASGCKFRLTDASVSRFHGSLLRTAAGLWIVDLLGQRGITVNDIPVRFGALADGDVLVIGRYHIRVHCRPTREGSADRGRQRSPARPPRHEHVSSGLIVDDWPATAMPLTQVTGEANKPQFPMAIQAFPSFPKLDVTVTEPVFPRTIGASELNESMLVPLVNQFGLMQQQMFDQFQQAMAMMVQMFGKMHRDQMEVIRAELDRLHDLTEEFHALKTELAQRTQVQPSATAPFEPAIGRAEMGRLTATDPIASSQSPAFEKSRVKEPFQVRESSGVQPASATRRVPEQSYSESPFSGAPTPSKPITAQSPPTEQIQADDQRLQAKKDDAAPKADFERDSVAWLHQRIMTLQQERETRWQKILKLLPGAV